MNPKNPDTIEALARRIEEALDASAALQTIVPPGHYRVRVTLENEKGRKLRRDAPATRFSPPSGRILLSFEPAPEHRETASEPQTSASPHIDSHIVDAIRALDRAERLPNFSFVSLKFFRDSSLVWKGFDWAQSDEERAAVLRSAIEDRIMITSKVHNPRTPQFPVTAIRLNRESAVVVSVLGNAAKRPRGFSPVAIRGESLSRTVLSGRR